MTQACKSVDICRDTFYRWLREDPDFKAAYQESREQAIEVTAANGTEAVALYRSLASRIDLVLTALKMPEMDGIQSF